MDRSNRVPREWGHWPPPQERINAVMTRAAKALAKRTAGQDRYRGVVFLAEPCTPQQLDIVAQPGQHLLVAGYIRGLGVNLGWKVVWEPATDLGRLEPIGVDHRSLLSGSGKN